MLAASHRKPVLQIRDSLNLTYDVTFDVGVSDMYQVAWWSVHVTSKPENIHKAVNASLDVLRGIATMRIMPYELERAKVTVLTKHDADTKVCCLLLNLNGLGGFGQAGELSSASGAESMMCMGMMCMGVHVRVRSPWSW